MKKLIALIFMCLTLQGCFFAAGAAAGAAAVAVVYDQRKIQNIVLDDRIVKAAKDQIQLRQDITQYSHIEVNCFNQVVLLTGETPTAEMREEIETLVHSVPRVKRIYNQIMVTKRASALTQANDSLITARIKAQMIATKGLKSSSIKVITENGVVYLMGIVTHEQADIAINIARQVSAVQSVVKIFQYID